MAKQRKGRYHVKKATLLVVGEGASEKAFVRYLRTLFGRNSNQRVTIESEDGGGPKSMIDNVIRKHRHQDFNHKALLLDEDKEIPANARRKAEKNQLELIISRPVCLEGMLLEVLGEKVPADASASDCKARLRPKLGEPSTNWQAYENCFPQTVLDTTSVQAIARLRELLKNE